MGSRIVDVEILPLKVLADERGAVLHMLRSDSPIFQGFGELYFSEVKADIIKGWKKNKKLTQLFAVPIGQMKLVLYDGREESPSFGAINEFYLGRPDNYALLKIPPAIWYAFQAVNGHDAMIANCINLPYSPEYAEQLPLINDTIPYQWI